MSTRTKNTYAVTIKEELRHNVPHWVARDAKGDWVTYGKIDKERSDDNIVFYMFHREEVRSVSRIDGVLTAEIYIYAKNAT